MIDNPFSNSFDDWFHFEAETEIEANFLEANSDELESASYSVQYYSESSGCEEDSNYLGSSLEEAVIDGPPEVINTAIVETIQIVVSGVVEAVSDHFSKAGNTNDSVSKSVVDANTIETQILSPPPSEDSHNLTEWIHLWLNECLVLSNSSGCEDITTELKALNSRWELPGFRLAFVGEFSRGKSSLGTSKK